MDQQQQFSGLLCHGSTLGHSSSTGAVLSDLATDFNAFLHLAPSTCLYHVATVVMLDKKK